MNATATARSPRVCGSCTFCCKVMGVEELSKPAGRWCSHCRSPGGCSIYAERPASCRAFTCQWLLDADMPHRFRPDRSKVVLTVDGAGAQERLVANCDLSNPLAWRRQPIYGLLKQQARAAWGSNTVVAKAGLRMWVITPTDDQELGEVDPRAILEVEQYGDGHALVRVLPPPGAAEGVAALGIEPASPSRGRPGS